MDGSERDQQMYAELAYYTLAHRDRGFIHQLAVDAYSAQHAGPETKPIAVALALAGLYLHLEKGFSGKQVQRAHMRLSRKKQQWPLFELPAGRGDVTIADVVEAPEGEQRDVAIERWCAAVWQAWHGSHARVVEWLERALREPEPVQPRRRRR
jgi:hypothetical protein